MLGVAVMTSCPLNESATHPSLPMSALPTRKSIYTVLRSPHVDKKSREQFEMRIHKRLIEIENSTPQTTEFLKKLSLPASVDVEIKV